MLLQGWHKPNPRASLSLVVADEGNQTLGTRKGNHSMRDVEELQFLRRKRTQQHDLAAGHIAL